MSLTLSYVFDKLNDDPSKWHYEFDKLLQILELIPPQDWSEIETCFIISTGRTGTAFLAEFFNNFNGILSEHETWPNLAYLGIDYAMENTSFVKAKEDIEKNRRSICKEIKRKNCSTYIEANNRLFSLINPLIDVYNVPKIIHVVRDGRDFIRSGITRNYYSKENTLPRIEATHFKDDEYFSEWKNMSQFEKVCWLWQKKDGFIYKDIKSYSNGITVKFEDIFNSPTKLKGIIDICDFLGLERKKAIPIFNRMQDNKINKTKKYRYPHWKDWDNELKDKFDRIAGEHMRIYYDYK